MNFPTLSEALITALLGSGAGLLGIAAALLALIPIGVQSIDAKKPGYFEREELGTQLKRSFRCALIAVWSALVTIFMCALVEINLLTCSLATVLAYLGLLALLVAATLLAVSITILTRLVVAST